LLKIQRKLHGKKAPVERWKRMEGRGVRILEEIRAGTPPQTGVEEGMRRCLQNEAHEGPKK